MKNRNTERKLKDSHFHFQRILKTITRNIWDCLVNISISDQRILRKSRKKLKSWKIYENELDKILVWSTMFDKRNNCKSHLENVNDHKSQTPTWWDPILISLNILLLTSRTTAMIMPIHPNSLVKCALKNHSKALKI